MTVYAFSSFKTYQIGAGKGELQFQDSKVKKKRDVIKKYKVVCY